MAVERTTIVTPSAMGTGAPGHYVDWHAIIAGAVVATAIGVVFAGFGAALGLSAISPQRGEGSVGFSLLLTGLWALITILASYAAGGYIAGRMRRRVDGAAGDEVSARDAIHGMVVWALAVLVGAWIATGIVGATARAAGGIASGAAQAAGAVVQGAGSVVAGAADAAGAAAGAAADNGGLDLSGFNPIEAVNNRLLRGTGEAVDPNATVSPVARDVIFEVARTGELTDENRGILADEIAANSTLTPEEANARIDEAVTQVNAVRDEAQARVDDLKAKAAEAEQAARDAADAARKGAVLTGFLIAAGFAVALGAAMWGAGIGGRHRDAGTLWGGFRSY